MAGQNDLPRAASALEDPVSIEANRRGQPSSSQVAVLDAVASRAMWSIVVLFAGGVLIGGVVWWLVPGNPMLAFLPVITLLVLGQPYLRRVLLLRRVRREAHTGTVAHCTGRVAVEGGRHTIEAPGVQAYSTALDRLAPGDYRCHYLPDTGWLLTVEALDPAESVTPPGAAAHPVVRPARPRRAVRRRT